MASLLFYTILRLYARSLGDCHKFEIELIIHKLGEGATDLPFIWK